MAKNTRSKAAQADPAEPVEPVESPAAVAPTPAGEGPSPELREQIAEQNREVAETTAEAAPQPERNDGVTSVELARIDPPNPEFPAAVANVQAGPADDFAGLDPAALTAEDVKRLDFGAIVGLGVEHIDEMDDGMTKSGALADARTHLAKARELVEGVQSGRLF